MELQQNLETTAVLGSEEAAADATTDIFIFQQNSQWSSDI